MTEEGEGLELMLGGMKISLWKEAESPWQNRNYEFVGLYTLDRIVLQTVVLQHVRHNRLH